MATGSTSCLRCPPDRSGLFPEIGVHCGKSCHVLESLRVLSYQGLQNLMPLVLAAMYFEACVLDHSTRLRGASRQTGSRHPRLHVLRVRYSRAPLSCLLRPTTRQMNPFAFDSSRRQQQPESWRKGGIASISPFLRIFGVDDEDAVYRMAQG